MAEAVSANAAKETYSPPPPYPGYESCNVPLTLPYGPPPPLYQLQPNDPANPNVINMYANQEQGGSEIQKKKMCGCGPNTWTKIIACINIFFSIATLVFKFANLSKATQSPTATLESERDDGTFSDVDLTDSRARFYGANSDPIVQIFEGFVGLAFGFVLLAGAIYRNPVLLLIWMVVAGIGILFLVLLMTGLFLAVLFGGGTPLLQVILVILIPTAVQIFFFRMVSMHRREIIDFKHQQENLHQNHIQLHPILQPQFPFPPAPMNVDLEDRPGKPIFRN